MNRLYVGSVRSGNNKGSFTVYDLSTSQQVTTINDIVYHQSVISLAYKNNKVFGGTSVYGGISSTVDATEGKVFVWNTTGANSTPVPQFVQPQEEKSFLISSWVRMGKYGDLRKETRQAIRPTTRPQICLLSVRIIQMLLIRPYIPTNSAQYPCLGRVGRWLLATMVMSM